MKRILCLCLCLILVLSASGCSFRRESVIYNTDSITYDFDDYVVFQPIRGLPVLYNKKTDRCEVFFRDPIQSAEISGFTFFAKEAGNRVAMVGGVRANYDIYRVELDSFQWDQDRGTLRAGVHDSYLGAGDLFPGLHNAAETVSGMFQGFIPYSNGYIVFRDNGVFLLEGQRRTQEECLKEEENIMMGNFAFDGQRVYYRTGDTELVSLDIDTAERVVLRPETTAFFLTERGLLVQYETRVALLDPDTDNEQTVVEDIEYLLGNTEEHVYYRANGYLCRVRWDGSGAEELPPDGQFHQLGIVSDPQWLFYFSDEGLCRCDYDGENETLITLPK